MHRTALKQGLSKHQEVCFTPVTKNIKIHCGFLGLCWCNKNKILKDKYQMDHKKNYEQCSLSNKQEVIFSKLFFQFLSEISLKFENRSFFSG